MWNLSDYDSTLCADSVLVVARHLDRLLFVKNRFRAWEFPGGHIEEGERPIDTAKREVWEEAQCRIDQIHFIATYTLASGHVTHVCLAEIDTVSKFQGNYETDERVFAKEIPTPLSFRDGLYDRIIQVYAEQTPR